MTRREAGIVGIVVAALVPALSGALFAPVSGHFSPMMALGTFIFLYPIALAVVAIAGSAALFLMRRVARRCWWCLMIAGFVIGVLFALLISWPLVPHLDTGLLYGLLGAVSALVFWLIWRCGRDRPDAAKPEAAASHH